MLPGDGHTLRPTSNSSLRTRLLPINMSPAWTTAADHQE